MSSESVKQGWLYKSPPDRRLYKDKWHWRYFVLRQGELPFQYFLDYYYTKRRFWKKGTIGLDQCLRLDAGFSFTGVKGKKLEHAFSLVTSTRTYYLVARTEEDMEEWVEAISHSIGLKDNPSAADSVASYPAQLQVSNARMSFRQSKDRNRLEKDGRADRLTEGASNAAEVFSNGATQNGRQSARDNPSPTTENHHCPVLHSPKPAADPPGTPVQTSSAVLSAVSRSESHGTPCAEEDMEETSRLHRQHSGPRRPPPRPVVDDDDEYQVPREDNDSPQPIMWTPSEKTLSAGRPRGQDAPRREPPAPPRLDAVIPPASTSSFQEEDYDIPPTSPHLDDDAMYINAGEMSPHSAGEGYVNVWETKVTHKTEAQRSYVRSASSPARQSGSQPKVQYLDLDLQPKAPTAARLDSDDHSPYRHIDFLRTQALDATLRQGRTDKQTMKETK